MAASLIFFFTKSKENIKQCRSGSGKWEVCFVLKSKVAMSTLGSVHLDWMPGFKGRATERVHELIPSPDAVAARSAPGHGSSTWMAAFERWLIFQCPASCVSRELKRLQSG